MAVFAAVAAIGSAVTADLTGKYLATYEPAKLATLEMVNTTTTNVPFIFGGVEGKDGAVAGPHISVPSGLSVLVGGSPDSAVRGLDTVPQQERPPVYIRALFNIKLTLIGLLCLGLGIYFVLRKWRPAWLGRTVVLTTLSVCSFVGIVIVELGWMLTEIGRQPWAVRGYVTTADAITKTHDITAYGYFFPVSYVFMFVMTILAVRQVVRMHRTKGGRV